ncbi:hypothetical protein RND71_040062 [Anisodus tanguticus]|uniref:Uncharacterized protein n=1 Tax=Anisodus tanguticus TaxID=243964 RepID=A0AAE1UVY0_9SOLA|nr:hypothetical protein RND71_040062 [Anisodus tanguticus]
MESEGNENTHQHLKRSKPTNHSQFPSTSMQDSSEILSRVPVKSLLQFRCVSNSWLALISTSEFVNTHLSLSANNKEYTHHMFMLSFIQPEYNLKDCSLGSLLYGFVTEAFDLDYPMKNPHKSVWIVGFVNGLSCLAIEEKDLFLWNPSIRMFKKLPDSRPTLRCGYYFMYGFGYDEVHDNYKGGVLLNDLGKFVNGKLHWATTARFGEYNDRDIISIDLSDEKWGKVEQPCYEEGNFDFVPGVLENDLFVLCNYQKTRADVWVMKEYGVKDSWTKMYTIRCPNDPVVGFGYDASTKDYKVVKILSFADIEGRHENMVWVYSLKAHKWSKMQGNGDEVLVKLDREIILYNSRNGSFKRLHYYPVE